jgi:hypothetical protein
MADDWKPGDLALCVRSGRSAYDPTRPGGVYTVERTLLDGDGVLCLALKNSPNKGPDYNGHIAARFRKIKPLTDEEREQFTADLNTPVKGPAHV